MSRAFFVILSLLVLGSSKLVYNEFFLPSIQLEDWYTVGEVTQNVRTSMVGNVPVLGGLNIFSGGAKASKLFLLNEAHHQVTVNLKFYRLNTWDFDRFYIIADGKTVHESMYTKLMGSNQVIDLSITFKHYTTSLFLLFTSSLEDQSGSWGISQLQIHIDNCHPSCLFCQEAGGCNGQNQALGFEAWNGRYLQSNGFARNGLAGADFSSVCAGAQILGGFNLFGSGVSISNRINQLQPHTKITIRFQFWKIDSWDNEEAFLLADGTKVWSYVGTYLDWLNICGAFYGDRVQDVSITFPHTERSVELSFQSKLDQPAWDESWGIRDFQLFTHN